MPIVAEADAVISPREIEAAAHHRRLDRLFRCRFLLAWLCDWFLINSRSELYLTLTKYVAKPYSLNTTGRNLPYFLGICRHISLIHLVIADYSHEVIKISNYRLLLSELRDCTDYNY